MIVAFFARVDQLQDPFPHVVAQTGNLVLEYLVQLIELIIGGATKTADLAFNAIG